MTAMAHASSRRLRSPLRPARSTVPADGAGPRIRALAGCPGSWSVCGPRIGYGALLATATVGSSHIRYVGPDLTLRLTTDASLTAITEERPFVVDRRMTLLFGRTRR